MSHETSEDVLIKQYRNHIWINSEITNELLLEFQEMFTQIQFNAYLEQSYVPITIHLHSPGGDVFAGLAIYDILKSYSGEITCIVEGFAGSAASIILMAAPLTRRFIRPSGFVLIHQASYIVGGKYPDIKDHVKMMALVDKRLHSIYRVATSQTSERVDEWLAHESWFGAEEAEAYNVAKLLISQHP